MKLILNLLGIAIVLAICWGISWDRKNIQWKTIAKALGIEVIIALIIVKIPIGRMLITLLSNGLTAVINCGNEDCPSYSEIFSPETSIYSLSKALEILSLSHH